MRAFLAIVPPRVVRDAVELVRDPLRDAAPGGRWVHPSLWHLTLKFLGDVEDELVPAVADLASEVAQRFEAFRLGLGGLGVYPNMERPRTLWVGSTQGAEQFEALAAALDGGLDGLGFQPEDEIIRAHLTVARFRDNHEFGELAGHIGPGAEIASFAVKELVLMRSVLRPRGPDYSVVEKLPLVIPEGFEVPDEEDLAADSAAAEPGAAEEPNPAAETEATSEA
ncbi:MAG: RNA 2',3'-cyclic phosphodiesterase [Armatimonadetes bacterium]|nr:RNA 2',3'-cyclic phosphodiesterase [Armatimonadota bacterium]